MLSLEGHKGVALSVMFVITCITSFSPLYIRTLFLKKVKGKTAEIGLSGCLCAGAGVLMATVFLHILPEAVEAVEGSMEDGLISPISYPITQVSLCFGFFLIYFIEELVHHCIDQKQSKNHRQKSSSIHLPNIESYTNKGFQANNDINDNNNSIKTGDVGESVSPHIHDHTHTHSYLKSMSVIGSLIVMIALSFHGFMEGMSLGLEKDHHDVWLMFAALCSHKIFISFSMSMELMEVGLPKKIHILFMMIFAFASPIGGLVGTIIIANSSETETAADVLAPAFLQAISAGTILYVTFCEVLERERAKTGGGLVKFACLLGGFTIIAALQVLDHDAEDADGLSISTKGTDMKHTFTEASAFLK